MVDSRHVENRKVTINQQAFDISPWKFATITQCGLKLIGWQNFEFLKSNMADGRHFDKSKNRHLCNSLTNRHKILHNDTLWFSEPYPQFKNGLPNNIWWRKAAILKKTLNRHNSAMFHQIAIEFTTMTHVNPLKHTQNQDSRQPMPRHGAYWHNLVNTTELSICGGDAAFCQITCCTWSLALSRATQQEHVTTGVKRHVGASDTTARRRSKWRLKPHDTTVNSRLSTCRHHTYWQLVSNPHDTHTLLLRNLLHRQISVHNHAKMQLQQNAQRTWTWLQTTIDQSALSISTTCCFRNLLHRSEQVAIQFWVAQLSNSPRQTCNESPVARLRNKSLRVIRVRLMTPANTAWCHHTRATGK